MKRRELERHLREHGCRPVDDGRTRWAGPAGLRRSAIPVHREIDFATARAICKQLGVTPPGGPR